MLITLLVCLSVNGWIKNTKLISTLKLPPFFKPRGALRSTV